MIAPTQKDFSCFYTEIVEKDGYEIYQYGRNHFDYILDIGANYGMFSVASKILNPQAKVVSFEPCKSTYDCLEKNSEGLFFETVNAALGNGEDLYFVDTGYSGCNLFVESDTGDYTVPSLTLPQIIDKYDVDMSKKVCIKMDCEGGEQYLIGDDEARDILLQCDHLGMEIHFPCPNNDRFSHLPPWEEWKNLTDSLRDTHEVNYSRSNKHRGFGHYIIKMKSNGNA